MSCDFGIPAPQSPFSDSSGKVTREWYAFLIALYGCAIKEDRVSYPFSFEQAIADDGLQGYPGLRGLRGLMGPPGDAGDEADRIIYLISKKQTVVAGNWNPADIGTSLVLSNGNNSVTRTASGTPAYCSVRGIKANSSGKLYFEITTDASYTAGLDTTVFVGVANASMDLNTSPQAGAGGVYDMARGQRDVFNESGYSGVTLAVPFLNQGGAHTVGIAVDFSTRVVAFYLDGSSIGNVTCSAGFGTLMPCCTLENGFTTTSVMTLLTHTSEFTQTPPAGYSPWST